MDTKSLTFCKNVPISSTHTAPCPRFFFVVVVVVGILSIQGFLNCLILDVLVGICCPHSCIDGLGQLLSVLLIAGSPNRAGVW